MSQPITLREEIKQILAQNNIKDFCAQEIMPLATQAFDMVELVTTLKYMRDAGVITVTRTAPYQKSQCIPYYQLAARQTAAQTPAPPTPKQEPAIMTKETQSKGLSKAIMAAVTARPGISLPDLANELRPAFAGLTEKKVQDMAYHMKKQLRVEGTGRGAIKTYFALESAPPPGKPDRPTKTKKQTKATRADCFPHTKTAGPAAAPLATLKPNRRIRFAIEVLDDNAILVEKDGAAIQLSAVEAQMLADMALASMITILEAT